MNVKVIRNGEFDSDHYLSKIKLKLLPNKVHQKLQKLLKYNTDRLAITEESIRKYQKEIKIIKHGNWQDVHQFPPVSYTHLDVYKRQNIS